MRQCADEDRRSTGVMEASQELANLVTLPRRTGLARLSSQCAGASQAIGYRDAIQLGSPGSTLVALKRLDGLLFWGRYLCTANAAGFSSRSTVQSKDTDLMGD